LQQSTSVYPSTAALRCHAIIGSFGAVLQQQLSYNQYRHSQRNRTVL